jgi:cell division protein FtsB
MTATTTTAQANYKTLLVSARKLKGKTQILLFQRVAILCQVFDDQQFRADCGAADDFAAGAALDSELDDTGFEFLQLRAVIQRFPAAEDWSKSTLATMYAAVLAQSAEARHADEPPRTRHVIKQSEYAELKKRTDKLVETVKTLRPVADRVQELEAELAAANARIAFLERENANLRGQLVQPIVAVA